MVPLITERITFNIFNLKWIIFSSLPAAEWNLLDYKNPMNTIKILLYICYGDNIETQPLLKKKDWYTHAKRVSEIYF